MPKRQWSAASIEKTNVTAVRSLAGRIPDGTGSGPDLDPVRAMLRLIPRVSRRAPTPG
jgi:hypothetical protein